MGNQLDRITHLNYSELPTGDPAGIEKEELRVGVAYFFSDEEEEMMDDRVTTQQSVKFEDSSPNREGHLVRNELELSAFCGQECIFSKLRGNEELHVYPLKTLPGMCKAGDLLELIADDGRSPHWAVYVGSGQVIHLQRGEICQGSLFELGAGRMGRVVNNWYRYRPLPADLVLQNACGHLGLKSDDICWTNSESFAAWCRFGKREFKASGEVQTGHQQYYLKVHLSENSVQTLRFQSLEDLVREKRRIDSSGRLGFLKEFSIPDVED